MFCLIFLLWHIVLVTELMARLCKDLVIEIQRMWNVKAEMMPIIIGATGTISKSLRQYLSNVTGKHEIKELQKKKQPYWAQHTYKKKSKHKRPQKMSHAK
jgi:hypothetical protein